MYVYRPGRSLTTTAFDPVCATPVISLFTPGPTKWKGEDRPFTNP